MPHAVLTDVSGANHRYSVGARFLNEIRDFFAAANETIGICGLVPGPPSAPF